MVNCGNCNKNKKLAQNANTVYLKLLDLRKSFFADLEDATNFTAVELSLITNNLADSVETLLNDDTYYQNGIITNLGGSIRSLVCQTLYLKANDTTVQEVSLLADLQTAAPGTINETTGEYYDRLDLLIRFYGKMTTLANCCAEECNVTDAINIFGNTPPTDGQVSGTADRPNPVEGDEYIDSTNGNRFVFTGGAWRFTLVGGDSKAINILGTTPPVDGQTTGTADRPTPADGDEYVDENTGDRFIYRAGIWTLAPTTSIKHFFGLNTTSQTISSNSWTDISWQTQLYVDDPPYTLTANQEISFSQARRYKITVQLVAELTAEAAGQGNNPDPEYVWVAGRIVLQSGGIGNFSPILQSYTNLNLQNVEGTIKEETIYYIGDFGIDDVIKIQARNYTDSNPPNRGTVETYTETISLPPGNLNGIYISKLIIETRD